MFLEIDEMKDVLYGYQMNEIAENDDTIIESGIIAGVAEVKAYFTASNQKQWNDGRPRYDAAAIFSATGNNRDAFVLRMCKTVAAWNICELSNVDMIYDQVKERYENVIKTLEKIAGMGEYKNAPTLTPDLPTLAPEQIPPLGGGGAINNKPFRYGSRTKFNHE